MIPRGSVTYSRDHCAMIYVDKINVSSNSYVSYVAYRKKGTMWNPNVAPSSLFLKTYVRCVSVSMHRDFCYVDKIKGAT